MSNELAVIENSNSRAIMPVMGIEQAIARRAAIVDFTRQLMVKDVDYGRVPGTDKDTLLKPGAEKLTSLFGLSPRFEIVERETDWTGERHGGEPFFYFQYRCKLFYGEWVAGEGIGSCNSWEKKYRYRKAEPVCPECGAMAIKKSKYPPRNNPQAVPGWYCYSKAGGCGAEFDAKAPAIVDQPRGDVPNPNVADTVNTVDKMAQKRALIAATLIAVNASEFFTQDLEDMDFGIVEGEFVETTRQPVTTAPKNKQPVKMAEWTEGPSGERVDPPTNIEGYAIGDAVTVAGKAGVKTGDVIGLDFDKSLVQVAIDSNGALWLKPDKLSKPEQPTQQAAFDSLPSASGAFDSE